MRSVSSLLANLSTPTEPSVQGRRRTVRVSRDVFDELDRRLGPDRGPNGEPSVNDFLTIELLPIVDAFAVRFDDLAEALPGRSDYRMLITAGALVRGVAVIGQLTSDETIELLHIKLDLDTPWGK